MLELKMSDEFRSRQTRFSHFMQHRVHGREHNVWWNFFSLKNVSHIYCILNFSCMVVWWIPFRQKSFSHSIHVLPQSVSALSSSKNVYHISRMLQHIMLHHFPFRQKTFLTFTAISTSWYSPWCRMNFLLVKKRFSHILHLCVHFELHRSQLPFRPRTSTYFRQC